MNRHVINESEIETGHEFSAKKSCESCDCNLKLQLHRRSLQEVVSNFAGSKYVDCKMTCPGYTEFDHYDCISAAVKFEMFQTAQKCSFLLSAALQNAVTALV